MRITLVVVLSAALVAPVLGQIWDNGDAAPLYTLHFSQLDLVYPFNCQVADDFRLSDQQAFVRPVRLTGASWIGGWVSPGWPPPAPAFFNVMLYDDAGGVPTGVGLPDPTPTALAAEAFHLLGIDKQPLNDTLWLFRVDLTNREFVVLPDQRYWIAVQAEHVFPPKWGWSDSNEPVHGRPGVQGFPAINVPYWTVVDVDFAFTLDGYELPAGDLNCDDVVDFGDINPFVLALTDATAYAREHPDCHYLLADINADGHVGFGDINPFVGLLAG